MTLGPLLSDTAVILWDPLDVASLSATALVCGVAMASPDSGSSWPGNLHQTGNP